MTAGWPGRGTRATTAGHRGTVYGGRAALPQGAGNIAALSRVTSERHRRDRAVSPPPGSRSVRHGHVRQSRRDARH
ncbi:hypothetical protein HMPREF1129_2171 [Actinomyces naeslundii str. Howell 279]|uniref:Uncharacterized protein n=1 Tax=Actinomyces naeslundii (strain ATCC 12104 / DSM 43013 / CCUG 2238 / JCM 8349 / NCTC 10301 / Howell 279) TaxID=1115803 RepID=J3F549_ACTNH|nr:hypothetical protein HMPREF1129_2171 [Actinomyces naeslundii str. Howell 279]